LQGEIQDYHRGQLEKDGIFLPPREETVLTLSGNFTQKELDKAAKKGAKKQSNIAAPTVEKSLDNETLSDTAAATDDIDISKYCQPNFDKASTIAKKLGLQGDPKQTKDFADMYPDYFTYNEKSRKLSYKPKK
jgi:hypothetical protein